MWLRGRWRGLSPADRNPARGRYRFHQLQIRIEQTALGGIQSPDWVVVEILLLLNPLRLAPETVVHDVAIKIHAYAEYVALEIGRTHILAEDKRRQAADRIMGMHLICYIVDYNLHTPFATIEDAQPFAVLNLVSREKLVKVVRQKYVIYVLFHNE